jgi:DNA modification methylase
MAYTLHCGDCLDILPTIPAASIDAVICDPPYPEISRDYGRMTEDDWWAMMMGVCAEVRRVLKPTGSAVFILQPNSRKVGSMRGWLWRFLAWATEEWNVIQDVYWWNYAMPPTVHCNRQNGLMRPSLKYAIWLGDSGCYRRQSAVLLPASDATLNDKRINRHDLEYKPSGLSVRYGRMLTTSVERGGVTPFNVFVGANSDSSQGSGTYGHGAGTPLKLADWWTRYIVPTGGVVLDPFNGAGTMGVAALQNGAHYIGIEKMQKYIDVSHERLAKVQPALMEVA